MCVKFASFNTLFLSDGQPRNGDLIKRKWTPHQNQKVGPYRSLQLR